MGPPGLLDGESEPRMDLEVINASIAKNVKGLCYRRVRWEELLQEFT